MKNKLIVFEGIDGVGKTTLAELLRDKLVRQGIKTIRFEEIEEKDSGFNLIKPFIKAQVPINSSLLFFLASAIYKSRRIERLLKHHWVICDRYIYSTLAYHKIRKASLCLFLDIKKIPLRLPDFLFLVKVADNIRLKKISNRPVNNICDFKMKTDRNFVGKMEKELEKFKRIVIDNSSLTPSEATEKIYKIVNEC